MSERRALIIDDEADIRALLEITLTRMGVETDSAADVSKARDLLASRSYDLCLTDMRLPDGSGLDIVSDIQEHHANTPVAVITAYGNAEDAVRSLKAGAFDFVSKPVDIDVLRRLVDTALRIKSKVPSDDPHRPTRPAILGKSPSILALRQTISKLARSQAPVHVCGESGSGKELVARSIHAESPRGDGEFVPVNCGAIPTELMESEFFGHVKGSFTGATASKPGLFASADGGTLFLDEVADLPLHMQVKLLRAIQERAIRPIGADREQATDVRIVSATHKNLADLVASGDFRQDLYYRLNVIEVHVPPLRERAEDIAELTTMLISSIAGRHGIDAPRIDDAALDTLLQHAFPGNVRELENILERATTMCEDATIRPGDLGLDLAATPNSSGNSIDENLEDLERARIEDALVRARFNKTRAAELLGISFRSLRYRLKKLGIEN